MVTYILLGCFSLDWDALKLAAEKNYTVEPPSHAGGGAYFIWAEERGELSLKQIYWGSHNDFFPAVAFTSFGDHFSVPRMALPDLLWRSASAAGRVQADEAVKDKLARVHQDALRASVGRAGQMFMALRDGAKTEKELIAASELPEDDAKHWLDLLQGLGYVSEAGGSYSAQVPVLAEKDERAVRALLKLSREIMQGWLTRNFEPIKSKLGNITPLRYGVPYAQVFTQIWHYIFGTTNRILAERGLLTDPYEPHRKYKGFIPAVWHPKLTP